MNFIVKGIFFDHNAYDILVEFLKEHGTEAVNMLFTEFNMEDALEVRFEEGQQQGQQEGQQAMLNLVNAMIADGHTDELSRLQEDTEFRREMFIRYHISGI